MNTTQVCARCVMDLSDPEIHFDSSGICNHCHSFEQETKKRWFPDKQGKMQLDRIIEQIRENGKGKDYDCVIGLSGGLDSSYLALQLKEYALRPLVVHVDGGWNSELAVFNIERVVKHCGYDLFTQVIDWEEMKDLQVAYLKSGIANQDVPQDHAFFATLYHFAVKNRIQYVISGGNIATESIFPEAWHHSAMDAKNLLAIHKTFGQNPLKSFPTISIFDYYIFYPFIYRMKTVRPLNYMPYNKSKALEFLKEKIGYKEYGRKHGESVFTKFFQNYYLPAKFGYDKRRPHLSSMIVSGQMTREDAMRELEKPLYEPGELAQDFAYVAKKLGISQEELTEIVHAKGRSYSEYANWDTYYWLLKKVQTIAERVLGRNIKNYA